MYSLRETCIKRTQESTYEIYVCVTKLIKRNEMWWFFNYFIIFSWGSLFYDFACPWSWIWWSCWASVLSGNHFCFLNVHPWCYRNTSGKLLDTVNIVSNIQLDKIVKTSSLPKIWLSFGSCMQTHFFFRALQNRVMYLEVLK